MNIETPLAADTPALPLEPPQPNKKSPMMQNTKRAREYTFLGMYEEARQAYKEAMTELRARKNLAKGRPDVYEMYRSFEKDLVEEMAQVEFQAEMVATGRIVKLQKPLGGTSGSQTPNQALPNYSQGYQSNSGAIDPQTMPRQVGMGGGMPPLRRPQEKKDKKLPFDAPPFAFHHFKTNPENPGQQQNFSNNDDFPVNVPNQRQMPRAPPQRPAIHHPSLSDPNLFNNPGGNPGQSFDNYANPYSNPDLSQRVVTPTDFTRLNHRHSQGNNDIVGIPGLRGHIPTYTSEQARAPRTNMSNPPGKDPDVWDPPSPKPSQKNPVRPQAVNKKPTLNAPTAQGRGKEAVSQGNTAGGRGYDRPWMNGVPQKQEKKADPDGKYRFLYHHYPDGAGPDADLIRGLEDTVFIANPSVNFDSIAGLEEAKESLKIDVLFALQMKEFFKGVRTPPKGTLLFGPPGTGKTMLAKAIATTGKTTFLNVNPSTLASKWKGDSEKLVRLLFEMARFYAPSTVFIDEIDSLLSERSSSEHESSRKVKTQFFTEIDGIVNANTQAESSQHVFILAATNRPWDLDDAILRRLTKRIYIPLPNAESRRKMFEMNLVGIKLAEDIDLNYLVRSTEKYNSTDINSVCQVASMAPLRKRMKQLASMQATMEIQNLQQELIQEPITMDDFKEAVSKVKSSATDKHTQQYEDWMKDHGSS